jgi:arrestin-related trafficking adapter 1
MPAKLINFVHRNTPNAAAAKNLLKNVAAKATSPSPLLQQPNNKPDSEVMDLLKRHSMSLSKHGARKSNQSIEAPKPAKIDIVTESPPLVSFNPEAESSGALFSGQLRLVVREKKTVFKTIEIQLFCSTSVKKSIVKDCPDCHSATKELHKWSFAPEPLALDVGEHKFPISYLFTGAMPATTHAHLCMLDYHWAATAVTTKGEEMRHAETLELKRAIHPGQDKNSVRVFPPTNITANLTHNPVIYESGDIPISMRLTGVSKVVEKTSLRWRLRRLVWRIDEVEKIVSHPCPNHTSKVPDGGVGVMYEETRTIGEDEVNYQKNPWKTDIQAGEIDAEFICHLNTRLKRPPVCDVAAGAEPYGMTISHHLVVELVVVEETAPLRRPTQTAPTGAARILRSQFPLILTARAGLGIAWDEETPPVYQDVPPSPPSYRQNTTECDPFDISELGDDFESLQLGESLVGVAAGPSSASASPAFSSTQSPRTLVGMSPRLVAAAMSPRLQARAARERSANRSGPSASPMARPSSSGGSRGRNMRLSEDDFLQEPPEYRLSRTEEEEEGQPDVQVGSAH